MSKEKIRTLLERHVQRIERRLDEREALNNTISRIRIGYFLIAVFTAYASYESIVKINGLLYLGVLSALIVIFFVLLDRHQKVEESLARFNVLFSINKEHLARLELDWENIPYNEFNFDKGQHPFAKDLNLTGKGSLVHLLDTMIYPESRELLVSWLMKESPDKSTLLNRQKLVNELADLKGFRDMIRVTGHQTKKKINPKDWSTSKMLQWLSEPAKTGYELPLIGLSVLSLNNIVSAILLLAGFESQLFLMGGLTAYIILYKINGAKIEGLFDAAYEIERIVDRFKNILLRLQTFKPNNKPAVRSLMSPFHQKGEDPSSFLRKVQKMMGRASVQQNQILWPLVNVTVPWDMYYAWRLQALKVELHQKLSVWLNTFYELEALNALAHFKFLNPDYTFPAIDDSGSALFQAKKLGHPLIDPKSKVCNDFEIQPGREVFLITGSNMAGKSTFLRTVAINLVLANAGAPVNAGHLSTRLFRVFTSINVVDSLGDGLSHFYAEVKRLRYLLEELDAPDQKYPLFYFVDEIYRGTNNRERYAGSAAFLKYIAQKQGVGMVSSHDLELADLEAEIDNLSNLHFSESIENGKMSFNYKLKQGPCPSTNALTIMKMEGLPVD